jgi:ATP-dependent DNA ligase
LNYIILIHITHQKVMASDKRSFIDFEDFPGEIKGNLYSMPTLYKTASTGKAREWTIYCRLIKSDSQSQSLTKKQNWNLMSENEITLRQKWLEMGVKVPDGIIAEIWTENGLVTGTKSRSAASYIDTPKNQGKKNERNVLQQALVKMRGIYLKKVDEGSTTELINLTQAMAISHNTKFYPMLAKKYEDYADKIIYPIYMQPKLDGNRCIIFLNNIVKPTYQNVIMYTRDHKEHPNNAVNIRIKEELLPFLIRNYNEEEGGSIYLDGELYVHNVSLQKISSAVRDAKNMDSEEVIQYHVYDHFYPKYVKETFQERYRTLKLLWKLSKPDNNIIVLVETVEIQTREACDKQYQKYLLENYEGAMIRTVSGPYIKDPVKKSTQLRSKDLLKRKEIYDAEYEVVGYKDGSGKENGAVIWVCNSGNENGTTFNVTPNMTYEKRYKIYKECVDKFDTKYKNRLMTVQYRSLSDDGIPLQVKAIGFRDYE